MRKSALFITLILFCFSFSCKKENYSINAYVEGYVIDVVTKDSLANTEVQLWEDDRGGSTGLSDFDRKIATTFTDAEGHYAISFTGSKIKYYGIRAIKNLYDSIADLATFGARETFRMDYPMYPLSWLKIHIQNVLPSQPDDSIFFSPNVNKKGENVDTVFYREFRSTSPQIDFWDITENGITTRYSQITNCAPFDTCQLNVIY
ncbi:MAG: hypothetical protein IPJ93_05405 [Bacteroidota bacterium]|nr:hypothetical protein [Bacteroidia bacterium]MBP8667501.1 hypothetical protein [Bacteroidia bacterium]QQR96098.1 MAG: hypothetical protein IPJ93_05405 [Bacteroidota bacterium]